MMLSELKTFVLLAETGSVQAVAHRLPLTQPAVTRQLQRLESLLDVPLLDRRAKPVRLTPMGQALLPQARQVLSAVAELKRSASGQAEPEGLLRLGVAHALAEPSLADGLQALSHRYPGLMLQLASGWTRELLPKVDHGELDAALVFVAGDEDSLAAAPGRVLACEDLVFLAGRSLSLPARPTLRQLNDIGWILTPDASCGSRSLLRRAVERNGEVLNIAAEVHDLSMQASLVERGLGIGMVPKRRAATFRSSHLRRVGVADLRPRMAVCLVRGPFLGRIDKAIDALERDLAERLRRRR